MPHRFPADPRVDGHGHPARTGALLRSLLVVVLTLAFVGTGLLIALVFVATAIPLIVGTTLVAGYVLLLVALLSSARTRRTVLMVLVGLLLLSAAAVVASRAVTPAYVL